MSAALLSNIWFFLLALVWGIYIAQELFVSGVAMLIHTFRKDNDKYHQINESIGTYWDGIQVWLILAVGGTFAAFPKAFAAILTNLYIPIFLLLYVIIARGISIETIDKSSNPRIQMILKYTWFISSILLLVILAVYSINIFCGLPLDSKHSMNDSFFSFIYIFKMLPIITGVTFLIYGVVMGALYLKINTPSLVKDKFNNIVKIGPFISILFLVLIFIGLGSKGHIFEKGIFIQYPYLFSLPILAMLLGIIAGIMGLKRKYFTTFILMALTILIFIISGYLSLMPNFMISTLDPSNSLSIVDVAADQSTLIVMFISTLIFLPIVLGYQIYKYIRFWGE